MLVCEADWRESSGLRHRGGHLPLGSSGGYPARPSTLRSAQALCQPSPNSSGSARDPLGPGLSLRARRAKQSPVEAATARLQSLAALPRPPRRMRLIEKARKSAAPEFRDPGNFYRRGLTSRTRRPFAKWICATYRPVGLGIGRREAWIRTGSCLHVSSAHWGRVPPVRTCRSSSRVTSYAYSHRFTCVSRSIARRPS